MARAKKGRWLVIEKGDTYADVYTSLLALKRQVEYLVESGIEYEVFDLLDQAPLDVVVARSIQVTIQGENAS